MWRSREKASPKINPKHFSFKDVESLCSESPIHKPHPFSNFSSPSSYSNKTSVFHRVRRATAVLRAFSPPPNSKNEEPSAAQSQPPILPNAENRIVVYLTSLHVIRSTFEACRTVRSILRGFRVTVDERDLAMDPIYSQELHKIFNSSSNNEMTKLGLPIVFIGGKYIGGADELRQLNDTGELKKMLERLPAPPEADVCGECGGFRFLVCQECKGSHKVFVEKIGGFRSCFKCNDNGLIRCSSCSSAFF